MTKDEALTLALEAMLNFLDDISDEMFEAITAIKEALAQPEQEPVAFINVEQRKLEWAKYMTWDTPTVVNLPKIPLYTTPPQRKPLTHQEIVDLCDGTLTTWEQVRIARAIEAAHGIKENT